MSTYNWNNRVSITVPVGLNGWYYAGTITINGITTKFPVGVETNLPEPVAAMVQKMIEVEEGNKPIKPDNHYTGGVTIPKGKTLTIAKGASIFDENTAPTVILPETELTEKLGDAVFILRTPINAIPEDGKTYAVTFNGAAYDCTAARREFEGNVQYELGNYSFAGGEGGNVDAMFLVMVPDEETAAANGMSLGVVVPGDYAETTLTLSIVEAAEDDAPVTVLPETTLTINEDMGGFVVTSPLHVIPEPGSTLEINYNGVPYSCVVEKIYGNQEAVGCGKLASVGLGGGDENAPFILMIPLGEGTPYCAAVMGLDGISELTISIKKTADPTPGETFKVNVALSEDETGWKVASFDQAYREIKVAFDSGKMPYCLVTSTTSGKGCFYLSDITVHGADFIRAFGPAYEAVEFYPDGTVVYKGTADTST